MWESEEVVKEEGKQKAEKVDSMDWATERRRTNSRMQKQQGEGRKSRKMGQMEVSLRDKVYDVVRCAPTARCAASAMCA